MSNTDSLNLWREQRQGGQLRRNASGAIRLRYDLEWIAGGGFAVSHSLPPAACDFSPEEGTRPTLVLQPAARGRGARAHRPRPELPNTDFDLSLDFHTSGGKPLPIPPPLAVDQTSKNRGSGLLELFFRAYK